MPDLSTRLLPLPLALLLAALAGAAALHFYRRDRRRVPPAAGWLLLGLRLAAVVALVFLLADPVWRGAGTGPEEVFVVADASLSFSLQDSHRSAEEKALDAGAIGPGAAPGGAGTAPGSPAPVESPSRRDLVARALGGGWLRDLGARFRVSTFALSAALQPAALDEGGQFPAAAGAGTDLGEPLLAAALGRPPGTFAGIVVFTDGCHHGPSDARAAARALGALGVPLVLVGVGAQQAPPDLALAGVEVAGRVFAGDEVEAQAVVRSSGLPALDLPMSVMEGGSGGKVVKEFVAAIPAGEGTTRLPLRFPAGEAGRKKFTVSFPAQALEASAANNAGEVWIDVQSEKARVLLLDGGPRWEWRYLRSTWTRDRNVELKALLVAPAPDRRLPDEFPRSRDDLFSHDVLVLGDVEPAVFAAEEREQLRDFVTARGGALVLVAGERALPYHWSGTPLEDLLPVELLRPPPPPALAREAARKGLPLTLTPDGQASDIARLVAGRERNLELWELLPAPRWFSPLAGVKAGAEVLVAAAPAAAARLPGYPGPELAGSDFARRRGAVLATRAAGAGRVLYLGMDSTWLWRFSLGDEVHRRFWGQVVRWAVAERFTAEDEHARLGTDALLYRPPAKVRVEALVREAGGKPHESEYVDAVVTRPDGGAERRVRLQPVPRSGGRYRGELAIEEGEGQPRLEGGPPFVEYRVRLELADLPAYARLPRRAEAAFVVERPPSPELGDLACDQKLLEELATLSGGRFLPFHRFREAADILRERAGSAPASARAHEVQPWDYPLALALALAGLLGLEWALRKRLDLI